MPGRGSRAVWQRSLCCGEVEMHVCTRERERERERERDAASQRLTRGQEPEPEREKLGRVEGVPGAHDQSQSPSHTCPAGGIGTKSLSHLGEALMHERARPLH